MDKSTITAEDWIHIRNDFRDFVNRLHLAGLHDSHGLTTNRKVLLFLYHWCSISDLKEMTSAQWDNFSEMVRTRLSSTPRGLIADIEEVIESYRVAATPKPAQSQSYSAFDLRFLKTLKVSPA